MTQFFGYQDEAHARSILGDCWVDQIKAEGRHTTREIVTAGVEQATIIMHTYDFQGSRYGWSQKGRSES